MQSAFRGLGRGSVRDGVAPRLGQGSGAMNTLTAAAMRWFGPGDSVSVGGESRQTGATVVFSPLPGFPADEAWPAPAIRTRQEAVAAAG